MPIVYYLHQMRTFPRQLSGLYRLITLDTLYIHARSSVAELWWAVCYSHSRGMPNALEFRENKSVLASLPRTLASVARRRLILSFDGGYEKGSMTPRNGFTATGKQAASLLKTKWSIGLFLAPLQNWWFTQDSLIELSTLSTLDEDRSFGKSPILERGSLHIRWNLLALTCSLQKGTTLSAPSLGQGNAWLSSFICTDSSIIIFSLNMNWNETSWGISSILSAHCSSHCCSRCWNTHPHVLNAVPEEFRLSWCNLCKWIWATA